MLRLTSKRSNIGLREFYSAFDAGLINFSPADFSGLFAWWKADSLSLANGASVTSWPDSSGNGNTFNSVYYYYDPVFVASAQNSKPAVRFSGSQYLQAAHSMSLNLNSDFTLFLAYKAPSTNSAILCKRDGSNFNWGLMGGQTAGERMRLAWGLSPNNNLNSNLGAAGFQLFSITHANTANQVRFFRNGVADGSNPFTTPNEFTTGSSPLLIGAQDSSSPNSYYSGDILEFIGYNTLLSDADRGRVQTYLMNKYALT